MPILKKIITPPYIIVGNSSADMDSIVSAISLANLYSQLDPGNNYLPLANINKGELFLRPDVVYLLELLHFDLAQLYFRDTLNLNRKGNAFILVDHNRLNSSLAKFNFAVVEVIDHHQDEGEYHDLGLDKKIITNVGSNTTNIFQKYQSSKIVPDKDSAKMMLAAILLDTINLTAPFTTHEDQEAVNALLNWVQDEKGEGFDRKSFYEVLQKKRFDLSGLTTEQKMVKDGKEFELSHNQGQYFVSTILMSAEELKKSDPHFDEVMEKFRIENRYQVYIPMFAFEKDGDFKRELMIFGDIEIRQKVRELLKEIAVEWEANEFYDKCSIPNSFSRKVLEPKMRKLNLRQ